MNVDLAGIGLLGILIGVASLAITLLILWLIIYSAVKSALRSHQVDVDASAAPTG